MPVIAAFFMASSLRHGPRNGKPRPGGIFWRALGELHFQFRVSECYIVHMIASPARFCLRLLTVLAFTITMVTVGFGHQRVSAAPDGATGILSVYGDVSGDLCGDFGKAGDPAGTGSCPLCRLVDAAVLPTPLCLYRTMEYVALPDRVAETTIFAQRHRQISHAPRAPPAV